MLLCIADIQHPSWKQGSCNALLREDIDGFGHFHSLIRTSVPWSDVSEKYVWEGCLVSLLELKVVVCPKEIKEGGKQRCVNTCHKMCIMQVCFRRKAIYI